MFFSRPQGLSRSERNSSMVLDLGGSKGDVKVSGDLCPTYPYLEGEKETFESFFLEISG